MNEKLLEKNIKALLLNHLIKNNGLYKHVSIINEFTIDNLSRRADLLTVDNNKIIGYEIKSEADSLTRLEGQVEKYLEYFDKVIIVAAPKHIASVLRKVPSNVGVWEIQGDAFIVKQRGRIIKNQNKSKLINIFKISELKQLSKDLNLLPRSNNRKEIEESLLSSPVSALRKALLSNLSSRYSSTNDNFWKQVNNRNILPDDIACLSHYIEDRNKEKLEKATQKNLWSDWEKKLKTDPKVQALFKLNESLISS